MKTPQTIIETIKRSAIARGMTKANATIGVTSGYWTTGPKTGVKQAAAKPLEVWCLANTSAVDLEREVVLPTGLDVASYLMKNRNLFVDHNYDVMSAVAVCRDMSLTPQGWLCKGAFHDDMANQYVRACIALARAGTLAMSVGFEAMEWGPPTPEEREAYPGVESVVRKAKVLEVSYTALPMNVTCRMVGSNIEAAAENAEKARKALLDARISDRVVGDFGIQPRRVIVVR
jgi:hypothetical protein